MVRKSGTWGWGLYSLGVSASYIAGFQILTGSGNDKQQTSRARQGREQSIKQVVSKQPGSKEASVEKDAKASRVVTTSLGTPVRSWVP